MNMSIKNRCLIIVQNGVAQFSADDGVHVEILDLDEPYEGDDPYASISEEFKDLLNHL